MTGPGAEEEMDEYGIALACKACGKEFVGHYTEEACSDACQRTLQQAGSREAEKR